MPSQIAVFAVLFTCALLGAIVLANGVGTLASFGDFRGIVLALTAMFGLYVSAICIYRLFMRLLPLRTGEVVSGSSQEFVYHVYILFYLLLFYPVMRSGIFPAPLMRLFYLALGTRLGHNTYSQGIILDPPFVRIGNDSAIGQSALIVPHVIEGSRLAHYPIEIGHNVTIGAHAVLLSDVVVGDNAIVATGAVVLKGTRIGPGEVWGGVPARLIKVASQLN